MTKLDIISFYKSYKFLILKEMQELLDQPLENIAKIDNFHYKVWEGDVAAIFYFRKNYFDSPNLYFDISKVNNTYSLSWKFEESSIKNSKNFLRVLASGYQVITDFISNNSPEVISFGGLSKGHDNLYNGEVFQNRLKTLLGEEYDIISNIENSSIYIINKTVSNIKQEAILKRSEITSIQESITYWKYPHLHPSTPKNVRVKSKIKKRVIENLYFKKWL